MAESRNFADLVQATNAPLSPVQASEAQMLDMSKGETLRVHGVDAKENEEYGTLWEYDTERPDGTRLLFGLWANPQRDQTATTLMALCQDGPVDGVKLENLGTDKKPFYVIVPA